MIFVETGKTNESSVAHATRYDHLNEGICPKGTAAPEWLDSTKGEHIVYPENGTF